MGRPIFVACMLLLFLIVNPVSPEDCRLGTLDECKKALYVPGHYFAGAGFDITSMKRVWNGLADMGYWDRGNGTCVLYRNLWLGNDVWHKVAANVIQWNMISNCRNKALGNTFYTLNSLASMEGTTLSHKWSNDLKITIPKYSTTVQRTFSGSYSESVKEFRKKAVEKRSSYHLRETRCAFYKLGIKDEPTLDRRFKDAIDSLPPNFNSTSRNAYMRLIRTFGTHVTVHVTLGGLLRIITAIEECKLSLEGFNANTFTGCMAIKFGAYIGLKNAEGNAEYEYCKTQQNMNHFNYVSGQVSIYTFDDTRGGDPIHAIWQNGERKLREWISSLKKIPAIVKCTLKPIFTLLAKDNPRRESLEKAINYYILGRFLEIKCPEHCPRADNDCRCTCPADGITKGDCCGKQKHMARVTLWIDHARNLYGDMFGKSDSFVEVTFQGHFSKSEIFWNTDNPNYNFVYHLGICLILRHATKLTIRVKEWDQWGIATMGTCEIHLEAGPLQEKSCNLNHGYLKYRYLAECGQNLAGSECQNYVSIRPAYKENRYINNYEVVW